MKRKIELIVAIIVFIVSNYNIYAQNSSAQVGKFADLTLKISSTKSSFNKLEPIPIVFELSNRTTQNIFGHGTFYFSSNYVEVFVQNEAGEAQKIKPLSSYRGRFIGEESSINSGARIEHTELLILELEKYFPTAGNYKLQAVFRSKKSIESIKTNWLSITINRPQGADLAAYEFFKQGIDTSRVYESIENDEQLNFLETFVINYPNSPYTDYLKFIVAEKYLYKSEHKKAKEMLEKLINNKDFIFAQKAKIRLGEVENALRNEK